MEDIKKGILEESEKGNIIVSTIDGLQIMPIDKFIQQPAVSMLYDLNRNVATILTFLPDPKWINDYASAMVIIELKNKINELENQLK